MNGIFASALYDAAVGGTAAAVLAAIVWTVRRIKNGPPPKEAPLTRAQMIERLRGIADDPEFPSAEREQARARLAALGQQLQSK